MLAWCILVILVVEGGTNTSGGNIPDHEDILNMQDRLKEYRNIVRGGFFFNDSVIVMMIETLNTLGKGKAMKLNSLKRQNY